MTLASLGWGTWWLLLFVRKLSGRMPDLFLPQVISCAFATAGLGLALWCFRAHRSWMLFVVIPLLANLSLLFMPWLAYELLGKAPPP